MNKKQLRRSVLCIFWSLEQTVDQLQTYISYKLFAVSTSKSCQLDSLVLEYTVAEKVLSKGASYGKRQSNARRHVSIWCNIRTGLVWFSRKRLILIFSLKEERFPESRLPVLIHCERCQVVGNTLKARDASEDCL